MTRAKVPAEEAGFRRKVKPPPAPTTGESIRRAVRWIWGQRIIMAWILTLPCAAFIAALSYFILRHL